MLPLVRNFLIAFVIAGLIFGPTAYLLTNVILDCVGPSFGVVTEKDKPPQGSPENTAPVFPETDPPSTGDDDPDTPEPDGGDPFTMLIVGTDYQPDLLTDYDASAHKNYPLFEVEDKEKSSAASLSDYVRERRIGADAFVLVRVDTKTKRILYSALPSDMLVRSGGATLTLGELYTTLGMSYFLDKVNALTGFSVDYYTVLFMQDVERMIDSVGGVTVTVPFIMRYTDKYQDLEIDIRSGTQRLDGKTALDLIRFNGYPEGSPYSRVTSAGAVFEGFASSFSSQATLTKLQTLYGLLSGNSFTSFPATLLTDYTDLLAHFEQYEKVSVTYPGRYSYSAEEGTHFIPDTNSAILVYSKYR
ncbi:MAG: LCP family protein [Clostridia bacterium]|nr:LCP family protein [Clostridia bacterium]